MYRPIPVEPVCLRIAKEFMLLELLVVMVISGLLQGCRVFGSGGIPWKRYRGSRIGKEIGKSDYPLL